MNNFLMLIDKERFSPAYFHIGASLMNKHGFLIPLLLMTVGLTLSGKLHAETSQEKDLSIAEIASTLIFVETIIYANAYLASREPELYGTALALISPVVYRQDASTLINTVSIASVATIGLYNALELKKEKYSRTDIRRENIIAFHLLGVISYAMYRASDNSDPSQGFAIQALGDEIKFSLNYKF